MTFVDVASSEPAHRTHARLELGTCRAVSQGYASAADVSEAALKVILDADHKQMSTEHYCHVAAAANITTSGTRNLGFKLRAAIREHLMKISQEESDNCSLHQLQISLTHLKVTRKPALVAIAAFHHIELPEKATVEHTRTKITEHIISGHCAQFAGSHSSNSLPPDVSLPDCADVCKEWIQTVNVIHPDLQNKLKSYISMLRKGKHVERTTDKRAEDNHIQKAEARARYDEELWKIIASWPQLVPQSLKDKVINIFRDQTSSEALAAFTILMQPDLKLNEEYLLAQYKWFHPGCISPPMPYDDGPLRDLLVDPDGVSFSSNGVIKEAMIARCRSKCWIIQLKEKNHQAHPAQLPRRKRQPHCAARVVQQTHGGDAVRRPDLL
ncbi:hypothetical protein DFH09DRAFT_1288674 [Mycena vulgaris]|nr:hypothetical protein DFH09DRAFT_1288674 [Mycena vulgaris]